jgi:hypothetical protein
VLSATFVLKTQGSFAAFLITLLLLGCETTSPPIHANSTSVLTSPRSQLSSDAAAFISTATNPPTPSRYS